jgi:hypothetical protein
MAHCVNPNMAVVVINKGNEMVPTSKEKQP